MKTSRSSNNLVQLFFALILVLFTPSTAFYGLERINIDPYELESSATCKIVTTKDLIAYNCPDFLKIFLLHSSNSLIYSTNKAVAQIKASKLD